MRALVITLGVVLLLSLAAFLGFFFRPNIIVEVTPNTAKITVAGEGAVGKGNFTLMPGRHEIRVENSGYIPLIREQQFGIAKRTKLNITLKQIPQAAAATTETVSLVGISSDKKSLQFIGNNGKTLYARTENEQKPLTPNSFNSPVFLRLSPLQDVAILKNTSGDVMIHDFKRYDLVSQEQLFFGRDIGAIDWFYPSGDKLVYSYAPKSGERTLVVANRTNKELDRVANLLEGGIADPTISVAPDGKTAVVVSRPAGDFAKHNLFKFDFFTKRFTQLTNDGNKIDARFGPSGKRIIYTRFERDPAGLNNQRISVMDNDGKNRKDFDLRATLDQVTFLDDSHLIVVDTKPTGDSLYRLDLATGEKEQYYYTASSPLHFGKILLSPSGDFLYATGSAKAGEVNGILYVIKLETDEYT